MTQLALEIKNFRKVYKGGTVAVEDLSLQIPRGEFFGLLGPNGAGKSTTISCITGISLPTSGTISVFGVDVVKEYRTARTLVGLSPQEFNADFFGTVYNTLDYVAGYYGLVKSERKERIEMLLERFSLDEHKDKPFNQLSGGLKRRLMLARAMVHDPELIIFDEPTSGVDVELRHDLWKYMRELNEQGKTIILTSHYLEEVELLCNEIAIINKGKIAAQGLKAEFTKGGQKLEDVYLKITKGESW